MNYKNETFKKKAWKVGSVEFSIGWLFQLLEFGDEVHGDEVDQDGDGEAQRQVEDAHRTDGRCESGSGCSEQKQCSHFTRVTRPNLTSLCGKVD